MPQGNTITLRDASLVLSVKYKKTKILWNNGRVKRTDCDTNHNLKGTNKS